MLIALATLSIFAITFLAWLFANIRPPGVCPICVGVSGTWMWMLLALTLGYPIDPTIPALLMGGSVVGIAYRVEKFLPANRSPLLWKTLFIPTGFASASAVLSSSWPAAIALSALAVLIPLWFTKNASSGEDKLADPHARARAVEALIKKLEHCC